MKGTIMKLSNILKKSLVLGVSALLLCSCEDFLTIYPTDKTVLEDYWKTKEDVEMMATGAYKAMIASNIQQSAIIWGSYRSDELNLLSSSTNTALKNITAMNLLGTNSWCYWGAFYTVINDCNLVLKHAPEVVEIDPEFTSGDYDVIRSQMLALRSLCYFYLVRAFRDVPYNQEAYENDTQELYYGQTAPDSVLQCCINDLEEAAEISIATGGYGTTSWKNTGFITTDAIYAILADIYLWRGSLTHSQSDYEQCVYYANLVIDSKDALYNKQQGNSVVGSALKEDKYHLYDGEREYFYNFGMGNSRESILEWQYDGNNNVNSAVRDFYYATGSSDAHGLLMASSIFGGTPNTDANEAGGSTVFFSTNDYRYWAYIYDVTDGDATEYDIRKMCASSSDALTTNTTAAYTRKMGRSYEYFDQNWIVYRLTDVMLMKAEAQVQMASSDEDETTLKSAFDLVQTVNKRSMKTAATDTLKFVNYSSKEAMELLVLAERERELCFEGKRWFDLVRFSYRHMDTSYLDFSKTLYQMEQEGRTFAPVYNVMVDFVVRKYETGGNVVSYKLKTEPYLYFPISETQIDINPLLHQNPVYIQSTSADRVTD